jgi:5S rRNA maturation endonuclease (ribonuclease M5)
VKSGISEFQKRTTTQLEEKDEAWFLGQLESKRDVVTKGNYFEILCPFHPDTNIGSFGVNRIEGFYKCFSCGAKGPWNKLADELGMEKLKRLGEDTSVGAASMQDMKDGMTRALRRAGVEDPNKRHDKLRPIADPWPEKDDWRHVGGKFLKKLGCVRVVDLKHNTLRIGLPVRNPDGDLLGYTCRALDPEDADPKYTPMAADRTGWRKKELPASDALFLVEHAIRDDWEFVVLVEGPYDAIRLYSLGIPAIAILGTNNWTPQKAATIGALGFRAVVVLMDNDDSGREAQAKIVRDLSSTVKTLGLKLPKKVKDPGMMSDKQALWVRDKALALC